MTDLDLATKYRTTVQRIQRARLAFYQANPQDDAILSRIFPTGCTLQQAYRVFAKRSPEELEYRRVCLRQTIASKLNRLMCQSKLGYTYSANIVHNALLAESQGKPWVGVDYPTVDTTRPTEHTRRNPPRRVAIVGGFLRYVRVQYPRP